MIKSKEEIRPRGIEIDLTGPEGNAHVLLGCASNFCKQLGYSKFKTQCVLDEMMLTDYEGLLFTFDRYSVGKYSSYDRYRGRYNHLKENFKQKKKTAAEVAAIADDSGLSQKEAAIIQAGGSIETVIG